MLFFFLKAAFTEIYTCMCVYIDMCKGNREKPHISISSFSFFFLWFHSWKKQAELNGVIAEVLRRMWFLKCCGRVITGDANVIRYMTYGFENLFRSVRSGTNSLFLADGDVMGLLSSLSLLEVTGHTEPSDGFLEAHLPLASRPESGTMWLLTHFCLDCWNKCYLLLI